MWDREVALTSRIPGTGNWGSSGCHGNTGTFTKRWVRGVQEAPVLLTLCFLEGEIQQPEGHAEEPLAAGYLQGRTFRHVPEPLWPMRRSR